MTLSPAGPSALPSVRPASEAPAVAGVPLLGNAIGAAWDTARFFARCHKEYGAVFRIRYPGRTLTMLAGVGGVIFANRLIRTHCKVRVMQLALLGTVAINVLLFMVPREWILQALTLTMLSNFFHMMFIPLLFSTVPDTVDYGLRTVRKGAMAMFCAGHLCALSLGIAIGQVLAGGILALFGYQANVAQADTALLGIKIAFAGSSIVGGLLAFLCLRWYRLTRGWQDRITEAK